MARGRNNGAHHGGAITTNGKTTTLPATESPEDRQQRLISVSSEQLQKEIAGVRKELKTAKSAYSLAGNKVREIGKKLEDYLQEIDRRDEAAENERQLAMT